MLWFKIDYHSGQAVYQQIVDNFKSGIISGKLPIDEAIPSVRELARLLNVNPNTVARAYRELENADFIYSRAGVGSFISPQGMKSLEEKALEAIYPDLEKLIKLSASYNLPMEMLLKLFMNTLEMVYGGGDLNDDF